MCETVAIAFQAQAPHPSFIERLLALGFVVWAVTPYVAFIVAGRLLQDRRRAPIVVLVGAVLVCAPSMFIYYDAFFVHTDAQNALLFVFLPVYQWFAFGLVLTIAFLASWGSGPATPSSSAPGSTGS